MKKLFILVGLSIAIFFTFHNGEAASKVIISGSAQFDSSLSDSYMEKHGYVFIEESYYQNYLKTNVFGVKGAEVLIKNEFGNVLATAIADKEGKFSVGVPRGDLYKIIVRFHGEEVIKQVQYPKIENVVVYCGFYKSDTVAAWITEDYRAAASSEEEPENKDVVRTSYSRSYR